MPLFDDLSTGILFWDTLCLNIDDRARCNKIGGVNCTKTELVDNIVKRCQR